MRKPHAEDRVVCPDSKSGKEHPPTKVWDGADGTVYGVLGDHRHGPWGSGPICDRSGLPVPLVPRKPTPEPGQDRQT